MHDRSPMRHREQHELTNTMATDPLLPEGHFSPARRGILRGMVSALATPALASLASGLRPARSYAAPARVRNPALTIMYPGGAAARFDATYYRDHHAKLFMDIYGSAIERFELRTVFSPARQSAGEAIRRAGPADVFVAMINVWIADYDAFNARSTKAAYDAMGRDKKNFTNIESIVEVDDVLFAAGQPRAAPRIGDTCLSILYPDRAGARWDGERYCRSYAPLLLERLGPEAVERIEVRRGLQMLGGGEPGYLGGVNIYVRDRKAFADAWTRHRAELDSLSAGFASIRPLQLHTSVYGVDSAHSRS